jgi:hypothetical protein
MRARVLTVGPVPSLLCVVVAGLVFGGGSAFGAGGAGSGGCFDEQYRQGLSARLPDCRAYELVTPTVKNGALIGAEFNGGDPKPQVAEDGQDVVAMSIQCLAGAQSCVAVRERQGEPYEFVRTGGGWVTRPLVPSAARFVTRSVWDVDANEHTVFFSAPSPPEGQDDWYAEGPGESLTKIGPVSETGPTDLADLDGRSIMATGDLSHVVYAANYVWTFGGVFETNIGLYEYAAPGGPRPMLVGVTGGPGSTSLISACGTGVPASPGGGERYGSLSADGRTVFFSAHGGPGCFGTGANAGRELPAEELFARVDGESAGAYTLLISAATPATCTTEECHTASTAAAAAQFQGASGSGGRAYFTSEVQLTDGAGGGGENLYLSECEGCEGLGGSVAEAKRRLWDASEYAGGGRVVGGPRVKGVVALAPDGSRVYFVAEGVLTGEANGEHKMPVEGADNLYVYEAGGGVKFIATLPGSDEVEWENGVGLANVTPDGRFLVFLSHGALTADDTRGEGPSQVYRYDATTGSLLRVSVGAEGFNDDGNVGSGEAGIVPANRTFNPGVGAVRADPTMSHDGDYVFFESPNALTVGALDDVPSGGVEGGVPLLAENIYEWEADGTGSCARAAGCVSLISDGKDVSETSASEQQAVALIGSDGEGRNVFFQTNDSLVPEDTDTLRDFYDAHICSEAEPCHAPVVPPAASCEGEACRGPGGSPPPVFAAPSSATLAGEGNVSQRPAPVAVTPPKKVAVKKVVRCVRGRVREHGRCVKKRGRGGKGKPSKDRKRRR